MMTSARKLVFILSFVILSCNLSSKNNIDEIVSIVGRTMGTTYSVKYATGVKSNDDIIEYKNKIEEILRNVNMQMSTYIAESEISQFNRMRSTEWMNISCLLYTSDAADE